MPLAPALGINYPSGLIGIPADNQDEPREGRQMVPVEILWGTMGGTNKSVNFNLQDNNTLEISQISALKIDNSNCSVPVIFTFQDTGENILIPTGAKLALIPIFTNLVQFNASASTAISTDITRFKILNFPVLPVYIP